MATFNSQASAATATSSSNIAASILSSSINAAAVAEHFERATATFLLPSSTTHSPLHLDTFVQQQQQQQQQHHHHHQQQQQQQPTNNSATSSYTFVQIKREPCQVSEITTSNNRYQQRQQQQQQQQHARSSTTNHYHQQQLQQQQQQQLHHHQQQQQGCGVASSGASLSKTMSASSTLTTLVKIEAQSPKVSEMDKVTGASSAISASTNNSVPIGIAVARKRPQESTVTPLSSVSNTLPVPQSLNKDLNCFGIRVADLAGVGGVSTGCGNIYFTGNGDLMTGPSAAEELALTAAGVQSVNRAPSTFWQYPNALPIESVISMSPATVGLQYSRDANRGQVVLLPATPALGMSNFPLYCTPTDPFQQAAAAFVWPSYMSQGTTSSTIQPPPNFIFPSMSPHSTLQSQPYGTSLQLFGSNYLTAAAAAAAAAATSSLCQHNHQTSNSSNGSINLSLGATSTSTMNNSSGGGGIITANSCTTSSSRFLSVASAAAAAAAASSASVTSAATTYVDTQKHTTKHQITTLPLPTLPPQLNFSTSTVPASHSLILPPTAMKIEEWTGSSEFMAAAATKTTALAAHHLGTSCLPPPPLPPPPPTAPLNFELRDKHNTNTTIDLHASGTQALNLMRLPTPPTSANVENAAVAAQLPTQLLFQTAGSPVSTLLNLSATIPRSMPPTTTNFLNTTTTTLSATIGPPTPMSDDMALNFKTTNNIDSSLIDQSIVVGVSRLNTNTNSNETTTLNDTPQMQDVNIQTDTPVCSEDESSSCALNCAGEAHVFLQQQQQQGQHQLMDVQQPLELTKHTTNKQQAVQLQYEECHNTQLEEEGEEEDEEEEEERETTEEEERKQQRQGEEQVLEQHENAKTQTKPAPDLTGLELLSNISTSKLVKSAVTSIRIKQEPLDIMEMQQQQQQQQPKQPQTAIKESSIAINTNNNNIIENTQISNDYMIPQSTVQNEPLGALDLLCALAEQRIQEEVQSGGSGGVFSRPINMQSMENQEMESNSFGGDQAIVTTTITTTTMTSPNDNMSGTVKFTLSSLNNNYQVDKSESVNTTAINLTNSEGLMGKETLIDGVVMKRKKHKHSKASLSKKLLKSERKKNKKKKKKLAATAAIFSGSLAQDSEEMEYDEQQQLQEELKCTLSSLEPNLKQMGKWPPPSPQELFNIMETDMRLRLADITRQYRKKKRKLDEIKKNGKKKKCAKYAATHLQQKQDSSNLATLTTPTMTLGTPSLGLVASDYKFPKISSTNSSSYLNTSNFMRFSTEKSQASPLHVQFPPPEVRQSEDSPSLSATSSSSSSAAITTSNYKTLRLEPSALAAANNKCVCPTLRLSRKHPSSEKSLQTIACKECKLSHINSNNVCSSSSGSGNGLTPSRLQSPAVTEETSEVMPKNVNKEQTQQAIAVNRELTLTNEHLYRKETRVLTDMGGLFYAGVLKPLQPPDVYGITLDGERGNKSHIMSREEVLKDTIIEITPNNVESVPVGTRLCAYWSQQYRCLYPGRAIESESSDEESPSKRDFVSVEFDDGDSGRIRLQNIRLLLSDYPIAEYNDNPLYSLGKQKKSTVKSLESSTSTSCTNGVNANSSTATTSYKHAIYQSTLANSILFAQQQSKLIKNSTTSPTRQTNVLNEEQRNIGSSIKLSTKELLSKEQRSEKKRLKNLKKKAAAAAAAAAGSTSINGVSSSPTVTDDSLRKHRKHKKQKKKHKKHHHRKNFNNNNHNINNNNNNANSNNKIANGKKCDLNNTLQMSKQDLDMEMDEENDRSIDQEQTADNNYNENGDESNLAYNYTLLTSATTTIKVEPQRASNVTPLNVMKVKQENLFVDEEETTSNLMSETSDEAKGDEEVEHNNNKGSKIAAFLPDRQLWGWLGTAYRKAGMKGRARKQFYKTIKRGKEKITVGDSAVFLSTGRPDRPYIGRIESMWETTSSNKVVRVRWFYHPEETVGCPGLKYPGALFESPHEDENDVQTISHRCEVLPFTRYFAKFGADAKQYQSIYDNNDTYYLSGYYNPRLKVLTLQDDIPIHNDNEHNTITPAVKNNTSNINKNATT